MTIYDIQVHTIDGTPTTLAGFRNQVLLIVNVASKCGFTPQYRGLEQLYRQYQSQGFAVLAFPCNQFGYQEPGDADEIKNFCSLNYDISFPLFAKVEVNGRHAHPLFEHLKSTQPGVLGTEAIKWNFTKFLVDRQGQVIKRYAPTETPESLSQEIEHLLQAT
jgi:glutathione peroxidase